VEDAYRVDAGVLRAARDLDVLLGALVGLEADPDLEPAQVSSSLRMTRSPMRSIRITTRSSGSGQQTSESC